MNNNMPFGVSNIPSSRLNRAGYRTVTSSAEHNENQDNIINDILDLYNKSNKIEKELSEAVNVVNCENKYLSLKISELLQEIKNLENLANGAISEKVVNVYPSSVECPRVYPSKVDLVTSDITITPSVSTSKVKVENVDGGNVFIPPSLKTTLSEIRGAGVISVNDGDISKAFDGRNDTVWLRKVVTNNTVSSVTTTLTITLPEDVVTTYNVNEVRLCPFPLNSLNISSVKSRMANGVWSDIPSFKEHTSCVGGSVIDAPSVKFNFKDIVANQLEIKLVQERFVVENGNRVFYLGLSDIDVRTNKYYDKSNHFSFDINIPNSINNPMILGVDAIYNNKGQLAGNSVQYEFMYIGQDGLMHKVRDSIPFVSPSNNLTVKAKMFNGECTPNISRFKISYKNL